MNNNVMLSVVIPVYNEEKIIADSARELNGCLRARFPDGNYEIIFADDGSTDGTHTIAGKQPNSRVVGYGENRGKGCAVRTGVMAAHGQYIVYTDCDLAYGTDIILSVLDRLASGSFDAVIGSRRLLPGCYEGYTAKRRLMSKVFYKIVKSRAGFCFSDSQCGIKGFTSECANAVFSECETDGFAFDIEALLICDRLSYRVSEIPAKIINHRESKVNALRDSIRMLKALEKIRKKENRARKRASAPQQ